jgi:hypothetical protein
MCYWNGLSDKPHDFPKCKFFQGDDIDEYTLFKNSIRYSTRIHEKVCWICHVPNFGGKLHGKWNGPNSCRFLDIILPTLFFGWQTRKEELQEEFGIKWGSIEGFSFWLSGRLVNEEHKSNLVTAFLFLTK